MCQNKCIRFCLSLGNRSHIGISEFKEINWLPVRARFEQNVATHIFKQQNKLAPKYMNEMFTSADQCKIKTRSSSNKFIQPHCNRESGYKTISYLGTKLWNKLLSDTKMSKNPNYFKHNFKNIFFDTLEKENGDIYYYILLINNIFPFR